MILCSDGINDFKQTELGQLESHVAGGLHPDKRFGSQPLGYGAHHIVVLLELCVKLRQHVLIGRHDIIDDVLEPLDKHHHDHYGQYDEECGGHSHHSKVRDAFGHLQRRFRCFHSLLVFNNITKLIDFILH